MARLNRYLVEYTKGSATKSHYENRLAYSAFEASNLFIDRTSNTYVVRVWTTTEWRTPEARYESDYRCGQHCRHPRLCLQPDHPMGPFKDGDCDCGETAGSAAAWVDRDMPNEANPSTSEVRDG